jgi:predicted phosphohydrolase
MTGNLRLAFAADLHQGVRKTGDEAIRLLVDFLKADPPDVLVLAGDMGAGQEFATCLAQFRELACRKALVPGNHDIWVEDEDERGDSLRVYQEYLPRISAQHGFHYLDHEPLLLPDAGLALVGTMNWYDYSWTLDSLQRLVPDWEDRLRTKHFTRGRHNDARFVRWPLDDVAFTTQVVARFEQHLQQVLGQADKAIVITHHPPFQGLSFPRPGSPPTVDGLLWEAFSGNRAMEDVLRRNESHIPFALCGHTHRERENQFGRIHGINIGGDYHFKRLIKLEWPSGKTDAYVFGNPQGA